MKLRLSYLLNENLTLYRGDLPKLNHTEKQNKESFNRKTLFEFDSHSGTHIDYPAHFNKDGLFGEDYPPDYLCSSKAGLFCKDCRNLDPPEITTADLKKANLDKNIEILIIKTHFCDIRNEKRYWEAGPIIRAETGKYLKQNYPHLKAIGADIQSLTSLLAHAEGSQAHLQYLSKKDGDPVLIIEDMDLSKINPNQKMTSFSAIPLLFEKTDGAPCTCWAEIED